jgi:hypothetical protein
VIPQKLQELSELSDLRHALVDATTHAIESVTPEARARMIQLDVRHAEAAAGTPEIHGAVADAITPLSILVSAGSKPVVLGQDADLVQDVEQIPSLAENLEKSGRATKEKLHVVICSSERYAGERILHSCIAYRSA